MTLRALILGLTTLVVLLGFAAGAYTFSRGMDEFSQETSIRGVQLRGDALSQTFARALEAEWQRVREFGADVDLDDDPQLLQAQVDGFSKTGGHMSWAGIVGLDGDVIAATDAMLVDADVSQRPWFQRGLEGPFAGDVHEAVLLADLLSPGASDAPRFIDFSTPIVRDDDTVVGVFGVHIDWEWVRALLADDAASLGLDAILTNRSSEVLVSTLPPEEEASIASVPALRAAALGSAGTFTGTWPDGNRYFSIAIPEVTHAELPSFGWSLVARFDPVPIRQAGQRFTATMAIGGGLIVLAAMLALMLIASMTFRPLEYLVDKISRASKGEDVGFVQETRPYREAARLSNAIVRFQTRSN